MIQFNTCVSFLQRQLTNLLAGYLIGQPWNMDTVNAEQVSNVIENSGSELYLKVAPPILD